MSVIGGISRYHMHRGGSISLLQGFVVPKVRGLPYHTWATLETGFIYSIDGEYQRTRWVSGFRGYRYEKDEPG